MDMYNSNYIQLINRVKSIELNIDKLNKKMDFLISLINTKNSDENGTWSFSPSPLKDTTANANYRTGSTVDNCGNFYY